MSRRLTKLRSTELRRTSQPTAIPQGFGRAPFDPWGGTWFWPILVLIAGGVVYSRAWDAPHLLDGAQWIESRPEIRTLWPAKYLWLNSRPVVYFTFAVDWFFTRGELWNQHLTNRLIHGLAGLVVYLLVTCLLEAPQVGWKREQAQQTAGIAALLWIVHPLQTQSVTYLYQRFESLASLCYLVLLWATAQAVVTGKRRYAFLSLSAGLVGVGAKELMMTAPIAALLMDRCFFASRWKELWSRCALHLGNCTSWLVLAYLMLRTTPETSYQQAGIGRVDGVPPLVYLLNQGNVIVHYLRLSVLPINQSLDPGWPIAYDLTTLLPGYAAITLWLTVAGLYFVRRPPWGFLLFFPLLVLAPTSSVVPIVDLMFEHRFYLPLAAVTTLVAIVLQRVLSVRPFHQYTSIVVSVLLRRRRFRLPFFLWPVANCIEIRQSFIFKNDQVAPHHYRSVLNLARAYLVDGENLKAEERLRQFPRQLRALLSPDDSRRFQTTLAIALLRQNNPSAARPILEQVVTQDPADHIACSNLATALRDLKMFPEALAAIDQSLRYDRNAAAKHALRAEILLELQRDEDALNSLTNALRLDRANAHAHYVIALVAIKNSDPKVARAELSWILKNDPTHERAARLLRELSSASP